MPSILPTWIYDHVAPATLCTILTLTNLFTLTMTILGAIALFSPKARRAMIAFYGKAKKVLRTFFHEIWLDLIEAFKKLGK